MTAEQLRNIALNNAHHYDGLSGDAHALARVERDPIHQARLAANAAYYEERASFYRAQAATYNVPDWTMIPERVTPEELRLFAEHAYEEA